MTTLNSAVNKQATVARRNSTIGRALLIRRLNRLLALMGQALNTAQMARMK